MYKSHGYTFITLPDALKHTAKPLHNIEPGQEQKISENWFLKIDELS